MRSAVQYAITPAATSASASAASVVISTLPSCCLTFVSGSATRTNAIAECCTGTATYNMSIPSVAL